MSTLTVQVRKNNGEVFTKTIAEVADILNNGEMAGMLTKGYSIDGHDYSSIIPILLTLGNESIPFERDGKVVLPTYFMKSALYHYISNEFDKEESVKVEVEIPYENVVAVLME